MAALFTQAQTVAGLNTVSRKFAQVKEVDAALRPALYQREGHQIVKEKRFGLPVYHLRAWWFIYATCSPDSGTIPSVQLNGLVDSAALALAPDLTGRQTLGGLVTHAYVDGQIFFYDGLLPMDTDLITVLPITIVTAAGPTIPGI